MPVISRKSLIRDLFIKKCVCRHGKDGIYLNERTCFWGKRSYERGKKTASINNLRDRGYLPRSLLHLLKRGYVDLITIEQVMGTLYIHRSSKKKLYILQLLWERWVNESLFDINFCLDFSCSNLPVSDFMIYMLFIKNLQILFRLVWVLSHFKIGITGKMWKRKTST